MTIASASLNYSGLDTMLHMTCADACINDIDKYLAKAKNLGIRNILALRGGNCMHSKNNKLIAYCPLCKMETEIFSRFIVSDHELNE